jgi:glycerol uptake facilitator-like aquaporin
MTRRLVAEAIGTAFLVAVVVGSGVAGARLSNSAGLALLINAFATGAGLVALILALGPISGAQFNPAVTLCDAWLGGLRWSEAAAYCVVQVTGACAGAIAANAMYGLAPVQVSHHVRSAPALWGSEALATFGLLLVIWGCVRAGRSGSTAVAVGAYIAAAYFFTSSTSFANPAVTLGRTLTDTFSGIRPADVVAFIPAQLVGAAAATALMRWLYPQLPARAGQAVVAHEQPKDTSAGAAGRPAGARRARL